MHLEKISLKNFRNIALLELELHPRCNLFVGSNAQGKTNILEGLYFLSFGKSFRLFDYRNLIRWKEREAIVKASIFQSAGREEREALLNAEKKRFLKDGKNTATNQFRSMPAVLFAPEEILLLKEAPQARRDYIDGLLSKISDTYGNHLRRYKRALSHRNKLLKDENLPAEERKRQIILWETPMFEEGERLILERRIWTERLNEMLGVQYGKVSGDSKMARFVYEPNVSVEDYLVRQEERRDEEMERGVSLVGPHRDHFHPFLEERKIQDSGSQGEMRTFTLALKLSEIEIFEAVLGESPLLLLDDVISELDKNRNEHLFKTLQDFKGQIFATATSPELFPAGVAMGNFSCWEIRGGRLA